jgi:signal transduction histidine kinase
MCVCSSIIGFLERAVFPRRTPPLETLLNDALYQVRELSHGLHPVQADNQGLRSSLAGLAQQVTQVFGLSCRFECPAPVLVADGQVATNLYRIAQEATRNAAAHAAPKQVWIRLFQDLEGLHLMIRDDGRGLPPVSHGRKGLGLDIMKYRAASIGATYDLPAADERRSRRPSPCPALKK